MPIPLYRTVYHELKQRIVSAAYPPGAGLPSESKLSQEFGVSLITVRRAIDELILDGLIERRHGVGSFVRDRARNVVVGMSSFTSDVVSGRLRLVRTLLLDDLVTATPEVAGRLGVQVGSVLRHLVRLDTEGGAPLSVDDVFVPPALAVAITPAIAASPSFLFLWQDRTGLTLARVDFEVSVEASSRTDQELLQIAPEIPILITGDLIYDAECRPAMWVVTRYRGDRSRLYGSHMVVPKNGAVVDCGSTIGPAHEGMRTRPSEGQAAAPAERANG